MESNEAAVERTIRRGGVSPGVCAHTIRFLHQPPGHQVAYPEGLSHLTYCYYRYCPACGKKMTQPIPTAAS